jgi:hypothetical protein
MAKKTVKTEEAPAWLKEFIDDMYKKVSLCECGLAAVRNN